MGRKSTKKAMKNAEIKKGRAVHQQLDGASDGAGKKSTTPSRPPSACEIPKSPFADEIVNNAAARFAQDNRGQPQPAISPFSLRSNPIQFVSGGKLGQPNEDDPFTDGGKVEKKKQDHKPKAPRATDAQYQHLSESADITGKGSAPKMPVASVKETAQMTPAGSPKTPTETLKTPAESPKTPGQKTTTESQEKPALKTPVKSPQKPQIKTEQQKHLPPSFDGPADEKIPTKLAKGKSYRSDSISSSESDVIVFRGKKATQARPVSSRQPAQDEQDDSPQKSQNGVRLIKTIQNGQLVIREAPQDEQKKSPRKYQPGSSQKAQNEPRQIKTIENGQLVIREATQAEPAQEEQSVSSEQEQSESPQKELNGRRFIKTIENGALVIREAPKMDAACEGIENTTVDTESKQEADHSGQVDDPQDETASEQALQDYVANVYQHHEQDLDWSDTDESFAPAAGDSQATDQWGPGHVEAAQEQGKDGNAESGDATKAQEKPEGLVADDDYNAAATKEVSYMADAEIARLLNKQASLGMPTDELILASEDLVDVEDDGFVRYSEKSHTSNRTRSKRHRRARQSQDASFPDAEALADALTADPYDGFDVMDFNRPSLKAKKGGRKAADPSLELSDEELAAQLHSTWEKDRAKKAERKKEREELRAEQTPGGKIARFTNPEDNEDRDPDYLFFDNSMESVKQVIRHFMTDHDKEVLALPIQPHYVREQVHQLAKVLRLTSKSQGKEPQRYIVLYRSLATLRYNENTINDIDALLAQRRYSDRGSTSSYQSRRRDNRGGNQKDWGARQKATYRDGDVVGASAPELGSDNRGRQILEKMGWKKGQGIGAEGKEGNPDSIRHTVKTTRAGLG